LDVIVGGSWRVCGIVRLLSHGLLRVWLVGALVPVALLRAASELLERVLWAVIRDSSSSSYRFDHLSGLSVLDCFGFVLLVGLWKRRGDDRIQNARGETIQEETDGFFAPNGVSCAANEFFEVRDILIYFWEAHLAPV
jgi:hypothetical protein